VCVPIELRVDVAARRLYAKASGVLTLLDCLTFVKTARAPVERRDWPMLFDAMDATTTEGEASIDQLVDEIIKMAAQEPGPRAYVALAAGDDALYRLMLYYEARLTDASIRVVRVFRQVADAQRWLDTMTAARRFTGA